MQNKLIETIKNPKNILVFLNNRGIVLLNDEQYIKMLFKIKTGKKLNIDTPRTFNEKLQWLKLNDRNPKYIKMVDKATAKNYFVDILRKNNIDNPEQYIIPTIGVYEKFSDINFDKLPNQFVIKCTHNSGSVVVCKDKHTLDIKKARKKINKALRRNFYLTGREWPYKDVKPRIIIEQYMEDTEVGELRDYKIYSFDGKNDYAMLCFDRFSKSGAKFIFFDKNWEIQKEMTNDGIKYGDKINAKKPENLKKMFKFASILSKGIKFVRADFYEVNGKLYFGELTFYPSSGFDINRKKITDNYLTKMLKIN